MPKGIAEGVDAFFRSRAFLLAARPAEGGVVAPLLEGIQQRLGLQGGAATHGAQIPGVDALRDCLLVAVDPQLRADGPAEFVTEGVHFRKLQAGIDVQEREWDRPGCKRFLRQTNHDRGVLAHRIEHHWALELGDYLADDMDTLRLQRVERVQAKRFSMYRTHTAVPLRQCYYNSARFRQPSRCGQIVALSGQFDAGRRRAFPTGIGKQARKSVAVPSGT